MECTTTKILSHVSSRLAVVGAVLPGKLGGNSHNSAPAAGDSIDSNWRHDDTHVSRVDRSRDKTVAASRRPHRYPQRIAAPRVTPVSARRSPQKYRYIASPTRRLSCPRCLASKNVTTHRGHPPRVGPVARDSF